jgi:hypothetical protein
VKSKSRSCLTAGKRLDRIAAWSGVVRGRSTAGVTRDSLIFCNISKQVSH